MTEPIDLAALRALAEKATAGRWFAEFGSDYTADFTAWVHNDSATVIADAAPDDAAFIAAFDPTIAAALLSEVESLRAALDTHLAMDEKVRKDFADAADDVHRAFCYPDHELVSRWDHDMAEALRARGYVLALAATEPTEREAAR